MEGSLPHTSQVALICSLLPALPLLPMLSVCDPMDCSPPGSFAHGILQARVLERVAISSSRGIFLTLLYACMYAESLSCSDSLQPYFMHACMLSH